MEIAGEIAEVGDRLSSNLEIGDAVIGFVVPDGEHGGYREDVVLPAQSVVAAPTNATPAEAATLPMNGLTAMQALDELALEPGQVIAVSGAAGAVGGYVIQLAKLAGLTVVADASETDEALIRSLGADVVVRRGEEFGTRLRKHVPEGVDGMVDAALLGVHALEGVKEGGKIATLRGEIDVGAGGWDVEVHRISVRKYAGETEKLVHLSDLVREERITLRLATVYPAARAAEAHRRLEGGGVRGRIVLSFDRADVW
jgi:NADPH:quinone reductase-like Zn-dependent oxidoreductase